MRVVVLGSAAGGGLPQWNCNCEVCSRARRGNQGVTVRTQSSLAIGTARGDWFLLNASPDVREQIGRTGALWPRVRARHSPIKGVVLTNADVDHIAGLLSLRERHAFTLYGTDRVIKTLAANPVFNVLDAELVQRRGVALDTAFPLEDASGEITNIFVEMFAVPGKVALYLEDASAGPNFGTVSEDTVGLKIVDRGTGRSFFYIPGCAAFPNTLAKRLKGAEVVFFDGTTWVDKEMGAAGVGEKTARRMGHMSMSGADGSIAGFASLGVRRKIFIHINNTNPVLLDDGPQRAEAEAAGWEIAWDGMEIAL